MIRIAVAVSLLVAGCSSPAASAPSVPSVPGPAPATRLTATLVSPVDITLTWSGTPAYSAGTVVEFATEPDGRFTILEFLPPGRDRFTHPDLMPRTPFYYRIRSIHGPVTDPVEVVLPARNGTRRTSGRFAVTVVGSDRLRLSWPDAVRDEEGYLVEVRPAGVPDYRVAALLDPGSTSYDHFTLPGEKRVSFRIRGFRSGPWSNIAHQKTGDAPEE